MDATLELTRLTLDDLPERLCAKASQIDSSEPDYADKLRNAAAVIRGWQGLPTCRKGRVGTSRNSEYVKCTRSVESWVWLINACYKAKAYHAHMVILLLLEQWERAQEVIRDAPERAERDAALRADVERLEAEEAL